MSERVLLVDDSLAIRKLIMFFLAERGFDYLEASDGADALHQLATHPPVSLVLCDYNMPGMNGVELTKVLRSDVVHSSTPVILMTATLDDDVRRQCLAAGANSFVRKPITAAALLDVVNRLLPSAPASGEKR